MRWGQCSGWLGAPRGMKSHFVQPWPVASHDATCAVLDYGTLRCPFPHAALMPMATATATATPTPAPMAVATATPTPLYAGTGAQKLRAKTCLGQSMPAFADDKMALLALFYVLPTDGGVGDTRVCGASSNPIHNKKRESLEI